MKYKAKIVNQIMIPFSSKIFNKKTTHFKDNLKEKSKIKIKF